MVHNFLLVFDGGQGDLLEGHLDAFSILGAGLQVHDLGVLGQELVDGLLLHLSVGFSIDFVAHQDEGEFVWLLRGALVHEFGDPGLDVVEGLNGRAGTFLLVMS